MNWDAAGAIGEVIGAAAVVISVVYLALQVRTQTEESRLAATRDLSAQQLDFLRSITEGKELATIYLQGVRDYEGLRDEERLRVSLMFQRGHFGLQSNNFFIRQVAISIRRISSL